MGDWLNTTIFQRGWFDLRRIDVLLFVFGCGLATHYWVFYGWRWAVLGTLLYILVVMISIWIL